VGTELNKAVSIRQGATAWWVERDGSASYIQRPIDTALL